MQIGRLGDEGDVSLIVPGLLVVSILGIAGVLFWISKKYPDDLEDADSPAVIATRATIDEIEEDAPDLHEEFNAIDELV